MKNNHKYSIYYLHDYCNQIQYNKLWDEERKSAETLICAQITLSWWMFIVLDGIVRCPLRNRWSTNKTPSRRQLAVHRRYVTVSVQACLWSLSKRPLSLSLSAHVALRASYTSRMVKTKKVGPYLLGRTLGEGSFGKVRLGIHTETHEHRAIKVVCSVCVYECIWVYLHW